MATVVCSYQAPAFRASDSPAAWMVRRSLTDSLATVGAVVGGEFDVIGAGMMAPWSRLHCSGSLGWRGDGRPTLTYEMVRGHTGVSPKDEGPAQPRRQSPCEKRLPAVTLHARLVSSKRDGAGLDVVRMRRWTRAG